MYSILAFSDWSALFGLILGVIGAMALTLGFLYCAVRVVRMAWK